MRAPPAYPILDDADPDAAWPSIAASCRISAWRCACVSSGTFAVRRFMSRCLIFPPVLVNQHELSLAALSLTT